MDQTLKVELVVEKDGSKFIFSMPYGSKYGAAYDAAFEVLQGIVEMSKQAAQTMEPKALTPEQLQEAANQAN